MILLHRLEQRRLRLGRRAVDITGTEILDEEQGTRKLRFVKGPLFAQIILADEINRTPPKTQAALLEAVPGP